MQPFIRHTGLAVPLDRVNVDTDQIIPKQFLKRIERTGFEDVLFYDWRYKPDGEPDPTFELNMPRYQGASILVTGRNFGCGSSREHAVWALHDYSIRVIVAPSFADIFLANCLSNGLLPITLSDELVTQLLDWIRAHDGYRLTADLDRCTLSDEQGFHTAFQIDPFHRHRLLNGLDDIGLTIQHEAAIEAYERTMSSV